MLNLEHIPYSAVTNGDITYDNWRKTLTPRYAIVWRDIGLGYAALVLLLAGLAQASSLPVGTQIILGLPGAVAAGFLLAYLSLFLHEAGHYNLHRDRFRNDRLATIFLCAPFGLDIHSYRKIHWLHHRHLGTPEDTESSYFNALSSVFLLESLTGIHLIRVMRKRNTDGLLTPQMKKNGLKMMVTGALVNVGILAVCYFEGGWAPALAWALGMLLFFPFFATLRQVLEHRDEAAEAGTDFSRADHGKITRLFTSGAFANIFGGAGFRKHLLHHWDPQVSYTRLTDVEDFLLQCESTRPIIDEARTTYGRTLRKLASR
jgi:fatty acid desaturase